jgi:hypothetical protein
VMAAFSSAAQVGAQNTKRQMSPLAAARDARDNSRSQPIRVIAPPSKESFG